jgi:hypothetical protein
MRLMTSIETFFQKLVAFPLPIPLGVNKIQRATHSHLGDSLENMKLPDELME